MGLLTKLKSVLGLDADDDRTGRGSRDVGVTVERDRDAADAQDDAAVDGADADASTTDSDESSASTAETAESTDATDAPDASADDAPATDDAVEDAEPAPEATAADATTADDVAAVDEETAETGEGPDASAPTEETAAPEGAAVTTIKGIGPAYADRLAEQGIETVPQLAEADADEIAEAADLAPGRVTQWVERAKAQQ